MESTVCLERGQAHAERSSATYLETLQKSCGNDDPGVVEVTTYEMVGCSCRSRFCPQCCVGMGWKLRDALKEVLTTFRGLQMWTLTVDPKLFNSPQEAYQYCKDKRVIGELVKFLDSKGHLHSRRYFCAVEWQKETHMVHYHLLVDASFIPREEVIDRWNRFRPKDAGPVVHANSCDCNRCFDAGIEGDEKPRASEIDGPDVKYRPGFGSVKYSAPKFASSDHAANYATKYVIKYPEEGFPNWVLDYTGKIHRYHVSKGFFPKPDKPSLEGACEKEAVVAEDDIDEDKCPPHCLCETCWDESGPPEERPKRKTRTVRERVANCRKEAVVIEKKTRIYPGGEFEEERVYLGHTLLPFEQACDLLGRYDNGRGRVDINYWDAHLVLTAEDRPEWTPQEKVIYLQRSFW